MYATIFGDVTRETSKMIELEEQRIYELIDLAKTYARLKNLVASEYINALLNPDTVGNYDAGLMVETLIEYHKNWLYKSVT